MASVNKAIIVGFLGKDPELRYAPSGDAVCNMSVATTDKWKDKESGEQKESTEWHRVTLFKKLAEVAGTYLKSGSQVYIEGKLKARKYKDKEGVERYTTEIHADVMQMLGSREEGKKENAPASTPSRQTSKAPASSSYDDFDDDISF